MLENWQEEYAKLMFGSGHTKESMDAAAEIKYAHMPEVFYKYRAVNEKTLNALKNGVLYSSPPQYLNDPFEAPINVSERAKMNFYQKGYDHLRNEKEFLPEATVEDKREIIDALARAFGGSYTDLKANCPFFNDIQSLIEHGDDIVTNTVIKIREQAKKTYNICSLTSEKDDPLMWTYYADGHSGFCVGYDIKGLGITNYLTQLTLPVLYSDKCSFIVDDIDGSVCMHALSSKILAYAPEKEWRIFFPYNEKPKPEPMPPPVAIYLGAKISEEDRTKLIEICNEKNIKVFQMKVDEVKQALYEERITL